VVGSPHLGHLAYSSPQLVSMASLLGYMRLLQLHLGHLIVNGFGCIILAPW